MPLIKLARVEELPPGQTKFFPLESGPVLLANFKGAVLWGPLIDCPWHHFQFDCHTGQNHFPANVYPKGLPYKKQLAPLKRYAVEIRDGEVWVDIP